MTNFLLQNTGCRIITLLGRVRLLNFLLHNSDQLCF